MGTVGEGLGDFAGVLARVADDCAVFHKKINRNVGGDGARKWSSGEQIGGLLAGLDSNSLALIA